jgi:hypothetical protein
MEQRYGAWARLLALTRILHDGARHGAMRIPARAGELFDPDRYPFLEGRPWGTRRVMGKRLASVPRISDGCVLGVLERLLVLDGERLSYRALDVEQIGSVYEAMMGFEVKPALGTSVALVPKSKGKGAPAHPVCDLDALLHQPGKDRGKWLKDECDVELPAAQATLLKQATGVAELLEALQKRRSPFTPQEVRRGGLVLHPTEERRRSGSHYTPRELTEPIVATTLRPIFEAFGGAPTPEQILALKVCDPAMGSGAFLVGACRYIGDKLVEAWQRQGQMPPMPPDEDPQLYARRLVAQQCLYGVDRNAYAVQLAKLSLWLVTLAREHPFTFLDHALRHGDSLVGLTYQQITTFHWARSRRWPTPTTPARSSCCCGRPTRSSTWSGGSAMQCSPPSSARRKTRRVNRCDQRSRCKQPTPSGGATWRHSLDCQTICVSMASCPSTGRLSSRKCSDGLRRGLTHSWAIHLSLAKSHSLALARRFTCRGYSPFTRGRTGMLTSLRISSAASTACCERAGRSV